MGRAEFFEPLMRTDPLSGDPPCTMILSILCDSKFDKPFRIRCRENSPSCVAVRFAPSSLRRQCGDEAVNALVIFAYTDPSIAERSELRANLPGLIVANFHRQNSILRKMLGGDLDKPTDLAK